MRKKIYCSRHTDTVFETFLFMETKNSDFKGVFSEEIFPKTFSKAVDRVFK